MVDYCTYHSDCGWVGVQHELESQDVEEQDSALQNVSASAAPPDARTTHTVARTTHTVPTDTDRRSVALTPRFSVRVPESVEEQEQSKPSLLRRLLACLRNFFTRNN